MGQTRVTQGVYITPLMSKGGSKVKLGLCMEPKFSLECVQMGHRSSQGCPDSLYYAFNIHRWVKGQIRVAQARYI